MRNYDGHLIIQNAEKLSNKEKIDVIAQNSNKSITIGFDSLSVKDSFSFITASLDKLVSMTKYDNTDEKDESKWILRATGKVTVDTVVKVIFSNRKVSSFTNWKRSISVWLHEPWIHLINLMKNNYPPNNNSTADWVKKVKLMMTATRQSKYGSILISKTWACIVIHTCKLMFYYWRMFEKILRDTCSNYYGLDPVYGYILPHFAFDAMLKLRPSILLYPD